MTVRQIWYRVWLDIALFGAKGFLTFVAPVIRLMGRVTTVGARLLTDGEHKQSDTSSDSQSGQEESTTEPPIPESTNERLIIRKQTDDSELVYHDSSFSNHNYIKMQRQMLLGTPDELASVITRLDALADEEAETVELTDEMRQELLDILTTAQDDGLGVTESMPEQTRTADAFDWDVTKTPTDALFITFFFDMNRYVTFEACVARPTTLGRLFPNVHRKKRLLDGTEGTIPEICEKETHFEFQF